uniref:I23O2 dioxygenase n=1 Tax=Apteryx owenii TaxID=8824 RepID=A0A8B9P546_APTOW
MQPRSTEPCGAQRLTASLSPLSTPTETELPAPYGLWMEIASSLPQLIASRQLRSLWQMPQLSAGDLSGREELHLAHLVLSFLTMGYLWQEGEEGAVKVLPRNLAVPFWEVSQRLGLPPILSHADFVLANWKRKTPGRPLEIENLDPIISLPGGESLRGFILVTLLVEKAAVPGIKVLRSRKPAGARVRALPRCCHLSAQPLTVYDLISLLDYVDPAVFYSVIRIFLSGWRDNPAMPHGLVYQGVSEEPLAYSGGSAAQSSVLHAFDELLGIRHSAESSESNAPLAAFLHRMRDYMPPPHRAFVEEIQRAPSLRQHVLSSGNGKLCAAFNQCVSALTDFRTHHIAIVTKYITTAAAKAKAGRGEPADGAGPPPGKPPSLLEAKGTGGSHIFRFLKSVRDTTREGMISA